MSGAGVAAAKARIQREFAAVHADLTKAFSELDLIAEVVDEELGELQITPETESVELVGTSKRIPTRPSPLKCRAVNKLLLRRSAVAAGFTLSSSTGRSARAMKSLSPSRCERRQKTRERRCEQKRSDQLAGVQRSVDRPRQVFNARRKRGLAQRAHRVRDGRVYNGADEPKCGALNLLSSKLRPMNRDAALWAIKNELPAR